MSNSVKAIHRTRKKPWRKVLVIICILGGVFGTTLAIRFWQNADELNRAYAGIRERHAGTKMESLVACLQDSEEPLAVKNHVIWILGELRDDRALPVLENLLTGEECDHQRDVCQHELEKAIQIIKDGRELTLWRWIRDTTTPCTRADEEPM